MPSGRTVMVYSHNRVGKTSLVRGLEPPVALLDVDCAARHVANTPGLTIIPFPWNLGTGKTTPYANRWRAFGDALEVRLTAEPSAITWLVVDTMTILQLRLEAEVRRTVPDNKYDVFTRSADAILEVYEGPLSRLVNAGLSVLTLVHCDDKRPPKRPSLNGNDFPPRLLNFHDKVGYLYIAPDQGGMQRVVGWNVTPDYLAGDRSQPAPDAAIPRL